MAAPAFVSPAGAQAAATSTPTSVAYPAATINANDALLAFCFSSGLNGFSSSSGGTWTGVGEVEVASSNSDVLTKRAAGGESGTISIANSGAVLKAYAMLAYRGIISSGAFIEGVATNSGTGGNTVCPNVTTLGPDRKVIYATFRDRYSGTIPTQPTGFTDRLRISETTSTDATIHVFDQDKATAGTVTGPSLDYGADANEWTVIGFALIPEPAAGQTISPSGLGSTAVYGSHTLANVAARTFGPVGALGSAAVYGSHTLSHSSVGQSIAPSGKASAAVFGTHTLSKIAARTISPSGVGSAVAYGSHVAANNSGVHSAAVYGFHQVAEEGFTVTVPPGIAHADAYGSHTVLNTVNAILPVDFESPAQYGSHTLTKEAVGTITHTGFENPKLYGTHSVFLPFQPIAPAGVSSGQRFGAHTLIGGVPNLDPPRMIEYRKVWEKTWSKTYG